MKFRNVLKFLVGSLLFSLVSFGGFAQCEAVVQEKIRYISDRNVLSEEGDVCKIIYGKNSEKGPVMLNINIEARWFSKSAEIEDEQWKRFLAHHKAISSAYEKDRVIKFAFYSGAAGFGRGDLPYDDELKFFEGNLNFVGLDETKGVAHFHAAVNLQDLLAKNDSKLKELSDKESKHAIYINKNEVSLHFFNNSISPSSYLGAFAGDSESDFACSFELKRFKDIN